MNEKNEISILGCGWVGYPLAKNLIEQGYCVKGSTTSPDRIEFLRQSHIDPFLVQLNPKIVTDRKGFFDSDILIIAIPPKNDPDNYLLQIEYIMKEVNISKISRVIYISSTSVYGNNNREVNEGSIAIPETKSGKVIKSIEDQFSTNNQFKTAVIRFGGLVGPGRHPGRFFAGKKNIPNGSAPINLIHLNDCLGLISVILKNDFFGKIINACAPDHPVRKEFYTLAAHVAGFAKPEFIDELKEWKIVNSVCVPNLLTYRYKINDWKKWLLSTSKGL